MKPQSRFRGIMSHSEARSLYTTRDHDDALAVAHSYREDGARARVVVVKTRYGHPYAWGVIVKEREA